MTNADIDYIEAELRQTTQPGSKVNPWPPTSKSPHWLNAYTRLESARTPAPPPPTGDVPSGITVGALKFSDEFDGSARAMPSAKWEAKTDVQNGTHMDGFTNVQVDGNSNLVITASKDASGVWHSGWISSEPAGSYTGQRYVAAKAQCAPGAGAWSAPVWEGAYPWDGQGLEVDVCEQLAKDGNGYHATVHHWDGATNPQHGQPVPVGADPTASFHLYGAAVYPTHIDFYFDNMKVSTVLNTDVGVADFTAFAQVMNVSLYMGGWGGAISAPEPVEMLVDFVRVYELVA